MFTTLQHQQHIIGRDVRRADMGVVLNGNGTFIRPMYNKDTTGVANTEGWRG